VRTSKPCINIRTIEAAFVLRTAWEGIGTLAIALVVLAAPVRAQAQPDFFKDKSIDLYIGYSVGGGYDLYARVLARHLNKHVPGHPTIVPRNMEGAGSMRLANWLYTVAPKDGTAIGTVSRAAAFERLLGRPGIAFDASRFSWIGSANDEVSVCVSWYTSGVSSFSDLLQKELIVGAAGAGSDDDQFPRVLNGLFGTKMRVINGYPGGNEIVLAMERGEVNGRCGYSWSSIKTTHPEWLDGHKINILAQFATAKHPDLPGIPLVTDFATNDEQRSILRLILARQALGRPFLAPPEIPADRVAALRAAFMWTMGDHEFLADADKLKLEIRPLSGEQTQAMVKQIYAEISPAVAKRAAALLY
jgi:tripartite-type tricarboxylate transporter receptor subunit TctC